ncbi:MAG: DUF2911 domain-containing protein [Verrucomicrobiota bacterium]|jgi:hypothetical protein
MLPTLRLPVALLAGSVLVTGLFAQAPAIQFPAPSPAGSIKQRVGVTDIEVTYNRPSAKGRTIFGSLVPYDAIWRTGADTATRLTLSTPAKLNGTSVPAGTYELFTIPGRTEWTFILQAAKDRPQWGSYAYDQKNDTARFTARPVALSTPVESLTFEIGDLRPNAATLALAWENTRVPVTVEVDTVGALVPQIEALMASAAEKKPYFEAAMFYFANNIDLDKALAWMDAGLAAQPKAYWMIYRKGLLLAKKGDKAGALAAARESMELAAQDNRSAELKQEYTRLNQALIDSLK